VGKMSVIKTRMLQLQNEMCNKRLANTSLFFKLKASGIGRKNLLDHNYFLFSQILRLKTTTTTTFLDL
jgi:hypothetical protein